MDSNNNLLVPAAQKLYSALSSLERFSKYNNFYDNISSLDNFLSEYRNVTFVIQKSLAHTNLRIFSDLGKLGDFQRGFERRGY